MATGVVATALGASLATTTACANDGCDTVKGKYRMELTLSAGQCERSLEAIIDTEAQSDTNGCTQKEKKTADTDTCKDEVNSTCTDGSSQLTVMNCKDDGASCSGTVQVTYPDGSGCIYDVTARRL
jgi:hypothetical protein